MRTEFFVEKFESIFDKLKAEIEQYPNDESLWIRDSYISNAAGNLCLHLMGNLNHYVGAGIGKSGYVRDRPLEFEDRDIARQELLSRLDKTREVVLSSLRGLSDERLGEPFVDGGHNAEDGSIEEELVGILTHFNYHLGQINYHRRLTAK
jgi:hypothetical protein